jgi:formate hydrogenlyase subunit 6/NADH:ubiquinone oxidoreductase subunit I
MSTTIYCFSGTGNSLKVAKDLAEGLENSNLVKINRGLLKGSLEAESDSIGIVFPIYYYGLPMMVREFVNDLKLEEDTYVFAVATCGGSVGAGMRQLKGIIEGKGAKLSAAFRIIMPDNYQVMYGPPSEEKQNTYFKAQVESTKKILNSIKNRETVKFHEKGKYLTKAFGGVLSGSFRPYEKDRNFWVDEKCNGCTICSRVCPADNVTMVEGKPTWHQKCEHCLACMQWCPQRSIQYNKGTVKRERYHHPEIRLKELFQ